MTFATLLLKEHLCKVWYIVSGIDVLLWTYLISGVRLFEKVCVEKVEVENGRVCGVKTNKGDIKCEVFVNCGGQVGKHCQYALELISD